MGWRFAGKLRWSRAVSTASGRQDPPENHLPEKKFNFLFSN